MDTPAKQLPTTNRPPTSLDNESPISLNNNEECKQATLSVHFWGLHSIPGGW